MDAKFFVIREPSAGFRTDPTKIHPTCLEAREEARRLATKHVGVTFYVAKVLIEVRAEATIAEAYDEGRGWGS